MVLGDGVGASPTKDNQIQEGVSSQPVGTVDRGAGSFACSPQTIHHLVLATLVGDHLKKKTIPNSTIKRFHQSSLS